MATIVTRAGKGSPLTHAEVDANFTNLNASVTTTAEITGGSINGATIGGTTPAAGKFTTLEATGVTTVQAGTNSAPAITPSGDTNTGIFFPAADTIAFAEGGAEAMRINSSGNVGIGTSSPGTRLNVVGGAIRGDISTAGTSLILSGTGSNFQVDHSVSGFATLLNSGGGLAFNTNGAERMRINSSGNVGIGTSSPATKLDVNGDVTITDKIIHSGDTNTAIRFPAADTISFETSGSERARITSDGNLCVGRTDVVAGARLSLKGDVADIVVRLNNSNTSSPGGVEMFYSGAAPNGAGDYFYWARDTGASRFYVQSNGGIANYQANNTNLSDRREKTNFAPAKNYLDTICAIPVQTFNYIDQSEYDPGLTLGVVAQDVQAVAPELVMESNWGTEEEPKMRLSIYQTDLQYAMMKAIQELKAELDTVRAELNLLKGI